MRLPFPILLVVSAVALSAQSPTIWHIRDVPAELRPTIARADLMVAMMHDSVLRELADEMQSVGPAKAVNSCHIDSLLITRRLAREGVVAGRTSDRLRNPTNAPPVWAAGVVSANAGRRASDVEGYAVDLGNRIGVLRPIAERPICSSCHGPVERLSAGVRAALAERYPRDKAVGFHDGEIRGWFWLELSKHPR